MIINISKHINMSMFSPGFEPPVFSEGATPLLHFLGTPAHSEVNLPPPLIFREPSKLVHVNCKDFKMKVLSFLPY